MSLFMGKLARLYFDIEEDDEDELKTYKCPKCRKKMDYVSYREKFNLKSHLVTNDGYWECKKCNIRCTSNKVPNYIKK